MVPLRCTAILLLILLAASRGYECHQDDATSLLQVQSTVTEGQKTIASLRPDPDIVENDLNSDVAAADSDIEQAQKTLDIEAEGAEKRDQNMKGEEKAIESALANKDLTPQQRQAVKDEGLDIAVQAGNEEAAVIESDTDRDAAGDQATLSNQADAEVANAQKEAKADIASDGVLEVAPPVEDQAEADGLDYDDLDGSTDVFTSGSHFSDDLAPGTEDQAEADVLDDGDLGGSTEVFTPGPYFSDDLTAATEDQVEADGVEAGNSEISMQAFASGPHFDDDLTSAAGGQTETDGLDDGS